MLGDLEGHGVASYIDDLGLYATSFDQYLQRLEMMLQRLDSVDIRLNGAKCEFRQRSMQFLGHTVSEAGIATPSRIEAIKQMAVPTTRTQLRSFLECATISRQHCQVGTNHKGALRFGRSERQGCILSW